MHSTKNVVIPNIEFDHLPTNLITIATTTPPSKINAFSHQRGHHLRISVSLNKDANRYLMENKFILNFLEKLVLEVEINDSNASIYIMAMTDKKGEFKRGRIRGVGF